MSFNLILHFTSPRIKKVNFSSFGTYKQTVGLKLSGKRYERILFPKMLRPNAPHTPNRFAPNRFCSNNFFLKLRLCMSILESCRNDLVVYS